MAFIDVERGLAIWKDANVYRQYLRKFARDYSDGIESIMHANPITAAAEAHKIHGIAANLALAEVARNAEEVNRLLRAADDATAEVAQLKSALRTALKSIADYASLADEDQGRLPENALEASQMSALFSRAITALNADTPDEIEPVLVIMSTLLSPERLAPIHAAVEDFDFRGAETATRKLAAELGIALET